VSIAPPNHRSSPDVHARRFLSALLVAAPVLYAPAARAADAVKTFSLTRTEESFVVPYGVHAIDVTAVGGKGSNSSAGRGGAGAKVSATLPVTPGQTLYARVGSYGVSFAGGSPMGGGFNGGGGAFWGGGGGGGASDIRTIQGGSAGSLESRLLIAGGGGGAGFPGNTSAGGNGGVNGANGTANGTTTTASGFGGATTAGGAAGVGCSSGSPQAGSLGNGGSGANSGGGGGGGLYGGGGGCELSPTAGGGGGGSSYVAPNAQNVVHASGAGIDPSISIRWSLPGLSVSDASIAEGGAGTTQTVTFTVSLDAPAGPDGVLFDVATVDGTATVADDDYTALSLTNVSIPAGATSKTINVSVIGDFDFEPHETFTLAVSNVRGAIEVDPVGQATITNDDTAPPTITSPGDVTTDEDTATAALPFTVADVDTDVASLVVSATSSNPAVIADSGLALGGAGASRTITITPVANASGTCTVTLTVSDGMKTASTTFAVTVGALDDAPTIAPLASVSVIAGETADIALTLADVDTPLDNLVVTATSSNASVAPGDAITFTGTGATRHAKIPTLAVTEGSSVITFTVSDGSASVQQTLTLDVKRAPAADAGDEDASAPDAGSEDASAPEDAGLSAADAGAPATSEFDDAGCGCRNVHTTTSNGGVGALLALVVAVGLRRRARRYLD